MSLSTVILVLLAASFAAFGYGYLFGRERKHHESNPLGWRRF